MMDVSSERSRIALEEKKIDASLLFGFLFDYHPFKGRVATTITRLFGVSNKLSMMLASYRRSGVDHLNCVELNK